MYSMRRNSSSPPYSRITSPSSLPRKRTSAFWVMTRVDWVMSIRLRKQRSIHSAMVAAESDSYSNTSSRPLSTFPAERSRAARPGSGHLHRGAMVPSGRGMLGVAERAVLVLQVLLPGQSLSAHVVLGIHGAHQQIANESHEQQPR